MISSGVLSVLDLSGEGVLYYSNGVISTVQTRNCDE